MILAETCFNEEHEFCVRGFHYHRSCSEPGKRGIAILINNRIKFKKIDISEVLDPSVEVVAVEIWVGSFSTLLVGVYRHLTRTPQYNTFLRIFALVDKFENSLFLGDFNAHHPLWGAPRANLAGKLIAEALDSHPLTILNSITPTFLPPPNKSPSLIDLAIGSASFSMLCEFFATNDTLGSDHLPISKLMMSLKQSRFFHTKSNLVLMSGRK